MSNTLESEPPSQEKDALEFAKRLLHDEEDGDGALSFEILKSSYDAYCIPLYRARERDEPICDALSATLGAFHINRLLQKFWDHGDFESLAEVWLKARPIVEEIIGDFQRKGGCTSCASSYFWSCRNLGSHLSLKCLECSDSSSGKVINESILLSDMTSEQRGILEVVSNALGLCDLKYRSCQECLS